MKILLDYLPIIFFFIAYKLAGIYVATGVAIATLCLQILICLLRRQPIESTQWINLGMLALLGGATIILHDEIYIKWKVSVVYWAFGLTLFLTQWISKKSLLKKLMGKQLSAPEAVWKNLSYAWGSFFMAMGFINLYVIYHYTTAQWVNFKLFGTLGLLLIFIIAQAFYLNPYMTENNDESATH